MRVGYCVPSDLYSYGLPRGSVPNPARQVAASAAGQRIVLRDHGFALGDLVSFRVDVGGGTFPAPLAADTPYYAIPLTDDAFAVSATAGGAAITLTTDGARVLVQTPLPVAAAIAFGAALIDDMLPAHLVPLVAPYPPLIVMTNAELAAAKLLQGKSDAPALSAMIDAAMKRIARWAQGVPLRGAGAPAQTPTNVAASASAPYQDSRGWSLFGGTTRPPGWGGGPPWR